MATFEHDAVIATLAARASAQVRSGLHEMHAGNYLAAEVFLNAACATLSSLQAAIDGTAPAKPMRKLCIVALPEREPLPSWMNCKHGEPDPDAA